jgi:DNA-binding NtrC family response regulator
VIRVLVADDDRGINAALAERLRARGYGVSQAYSGREALELARRERPDVVLLDVQMPEGDGFDVLDGLDGDGTVVMITAYGTVERAVAAMKKGAYDFIQKPFEPSLVEETVRRAAERSALRRQNLAWRAGEPEMVWADARTEEVRRLARKAAASDATLLLLGESGTGKEVLARQLHRWSGRADGPFVTINAVALAETLLESELFGHEKGAFTGATERRIGKIELAHGGTLFLDEIGDISPGFQAKLLRVLQEQTFERVGGNETRRVDVRFVAATNRDLKRAVDEGRFREDLFFRLNVISVTLPPLRERPADIEALARRFLGPRRLGAEAAALFRTYPWPGNVRELKNVIERAAVLSEGAEIGPADLPPEMQALPGAPEGSFHAQVEAFRRRVIEEALARAGGNQTRAADLLSLQRTYLSRLIRQMGIQTDTPRHP